MDIVRVKGEIGFDPSRSRFPIADVIAVGIAEDQVIRALEIGTDIDIEFTLCCIDPDFERP